jgi:DNA-binding MarR family transcriptional regulator
VVNPRTISGETTREARAAGASAALERAADRLARALERHAGAYGLTDAKLLLLETLDCCEGGCAGLCSIGDEMGVSRPNVTKLVDGLERAGLVERTPHPTDRRRVQARLTDAGRELVREAGPGRESVRSRAWDDLADAELASVVALLQRAAPAGRAATA